GSRPKCARISGRFEVALLRISSALMTVTPTGRSRLESGKRVAVITRVSSWAQPMERQPARKPVAMRRRMANLLGVFPDAEKRLKGCQAGLRTREDSH